MTFMLVTGRAPFEGFNEASIFRKITHAEPSFKHPMWEKVGGLWDDRNVGIITLVFSVC